MKLREQERELDSARNLERDRARALYADDHHVDSDVDEEPWRRRAFSQRCVLLVIMYVHHLTWQCSA